MKMKKTRMLLAAALAAGLALVPAAFAEEAGPLRRELKELAIQPAEIEAIEKIVEKDAVELAKASGDIKVAQARLERLMLDRPPQMDEIRKLVRSSLDLEYAIRMIRIERSIALRQLLGDRRWASLERLVRAYAQARRSGKLKEGDGAEAPAKFLGLLERLEW
ncbi:MAG TPA: hypothetical protein P5165_05530 [Spirochaetia bacterium]|nr:hypothetical protein [Spirochaetia bacterium]